MLSLSEGGKQMMASDFLLFVGLLLDIIIIT